MKHIAANRSQHLRRPVSFLFRLMMASAVVFTFLGCTSGQSPIRPAVTPSGSGTEEDPYQITVVGNLAWMSKKAGSSEGKYYKMMNDIDASETASWNGGKGFVPIGSETAPFKGAFDGNNKKITGLTIKRMDMGYIGLFGKIDVGSTIKNLGLENFTIVGRQFCGCLVGYVYSGSVSNCYSTGRVSGGDYCGGLVGHQEGGSISNCYSSGSVSGRNFCGGLAGDQRGGSTSNCYSTVSVSGGDHCAGLVGYAASGTISNCYSIGSVSGTGDYCGGLAGLYAAGVTNGCYYDTETSGQSDTLAGTPKTTAEMKRRATFSDWDFATIWGIKEKESYPYLLDLTSSDSLQVTPAPAPQPAVTPSGSGTETDPYLITVVGNLAWMSDTVTSSSGKYYKMMNDIDASETAKWDSGKGFVPIGSDAARFEGVFDGNNKKVTGLTIDRPDRDHVGLFGRTHAGSTIKNLGLEDFTIVGRRFCGGLAGAVSALSSSMPCVTNCYTIGSVRGSDQCGGLVGCQVFGSMSNCYSSGSVSGRWSCGGLVGCQGAGSISNCYSSGSVSGDDSCGGLVGYQKDNVGSISDCYSSGSVNGTSRCGGLVGRQSDGPIKNCHSTGSVSGAHQCGGLVGLLRSGSISQCYSTGRVTSTRKSCGGLVGHIDSGSISDCYSTGRVDCPDSCGGLVGFQVLGAISNCYSTGRVSLTFLSGGIVGFGASVTVNNCYYDTKTSKQMGDIGKGTPKTTAEMKQRATFSGWDFATIWGIKEKESYPYLLDSTSSGSLQVAPAPTPQAAVTPSGRKNTNDKVIFLPAPQPAVTPAGSGTEEDPYQITVVGNLVWMGDTVVSSWDRYYKMMNDIDASGTAAWNRGKGFVPIGENGKEFRGTFDGNNKKITGLTINRPDTEFIGLFGRAKNSTIKNLGLENFTIVGRQFCGCLVACQEGGSISNCYSTGSVSGSTGSCGGLIGYHNGGSVSNCYSTARVSGRMFCGGLVGSQVSGSIRGCYYDRGTSGKHDTGKGTPKTTAKMKQRATFSGWDFATIWGIKEKESYPYLLDSTSSGSLQVAPAPAPKTATIKNAVTTPIKSVYVNPDPKTPSGSGTEEDPYRITVVGNLVWMGNTVASSSGKYYKMMNDIDASETVEWNSGKGFVPIGNGGVPFKGTFDGNNKKITGLTIDRPKTEYIGLFGMIGTGSMVKDLGLEDFVIAGNNFCGGLAGCAAALSPSILCVTNCYSSGSVSGGDYCGGLVGYLRPGSISNCYSTARVSGGTECGGLVGVVFSGDLSNCYSTGSVSGAGSCGGLVGHYGRGSMSNCYSSGSVSGGEDSCGGLVGYISSGSISGCYSSGSVSCRGNKCGGLVGQQTDGSIRNCYSTGSVRSHNSVGGLSGTVCRGSFSNCYSTGRVSGTSDNCGGLVGTQTQEPAISGCYYDTETSGRNDTGKGTPKTTAEMKQRATFSGWDFGSIWGIKENENYPYLLDSILSGSPQVTHAPASQTAVMPSGSGAEGDPYQITVVGHLAWMSDTVTSSSGKYYKMMNDIDASETASWNSGKGFVPIGSETTPFKGAFDGNNKKITGLTINRPDRNFVGLFGRTYVGSTIKNLGLEDFTIAGDAFCGGLAGGMLADSLSALCVTNCYTSGSVSGTGNNCGGLVGYQEGGSISGCYSIGSVSGREHCGGLMGRIYSGNISNCYSSGSVSCRGNKCGGLVGYHATGSISNCYSTGSVSGSNLCGGLVGSPGSKTFISNCYSTGRVSNCKYCGGLVDSQYGGSISGCYYDTETSGRNDSGKGSAPKTTAEMKQRATFAGWDFATIWGIKEKESYPYLLDLPPRQP